MKISSQTFEKAKSLAASLQTKIEHSRKEDEKKFHRIMKQMLDNPLNKIFLIELLDQSFRTKDNIRVANQIEYLFEKYKDVDMFTQFETLLLWFFNHMGIYLPNISIPLFINYLRSDISHVIIKGEKSFLTQHLRNRKAEHTRVNINIIGESVLGEKEAKKRVQKYIETLKNPDIDYLSIKISTIFSQITPLAYEWSIDKISHRLEIIYRVAKKENKFINLDMEEFRDLPLTVDAFMQTLSKDEFKSLYAGIALQTYLPDTFEHLKRLTSWAKQRVKDGGSPIKVRLVKGANQEMELTEASLKGWPCVTFLNKADTDANYKVLMDYLLDSEVAPYIHTGIASHNLFDHALGMVLSKERGVQASYTAEMLEGMSEAAYTTLKNEGVDVILYAPTATLESFTNAIAYLVRRFDENTAEQNFMRHSFGLSVDSKAWKILLKSYDDAISSMPKIGSKSFRIQDRNIKPKKINSKNYIFKNESDTDFNLTQNHRWAEKIRNKWKNIATNGGYHATPVIGARSINSQTKIEVIDKSQYHQNIKVGSYIQTSISDLEKAVDIAVLDADGWSLLSSKERQKILMDVAYEFQKNRADLIGIAAAELGKVFSETDAEISEAIDFLNFYPYSVEKLSLLDDLQMQEKGVGLVISPWNFPIAIAVGGIAAALACGNRVILKPSSDAVLCAHMLCQCFWKAGVGKNTLLFTPTSGELAGKTLIPNPKIDFVVFTGSESTAYEMLKTRPDIELSAETGGKDATIVTSMADKDQAVKNIAASAFNYSGQKCSATSLLVLEKEIYEDESFKQTLIDAVSSLNVGSVWEFQNHLCALVNPPRGNLKKALEHLDADESWAIEPSYADDENPYMLKPSIRWGTKNGDFCHMNELFGPVLSVMCADNLLDAIEKVNATGYGLTSGLESLDKREQELWREKIFAGNLYINRATTGAIVLRQPFGGLGKSAVGSGRKAGGFNYVTQFMKLSSDTKKSNLAPHPFIESIKSILIEEAIFKNDVQKILNIVGNFAYWLKKEFLQEHDYSNIRGESNIFRYLSMKSILLRLEDSDNIYEILCSIIAIKITGAKLHLSLSKEVKTEIFIWLKNNYNSFLDVDDTFSLEDEKELIQHMKQVQRIRFLNSKHITKNIYSAMAKEAIYISSEPFIANGRVEMLHYFSEQSISNSYHRYGNIGLK